MDDLDRMLVRLVQNIRSAYPGYLTRPFEVAELYQTLIPYRHNRRELSIESNGDYEMALCRMLVGERGFLAADEQVRRAIRAELQGNNPNTAIFREFAASRVSLAPEAVAKAEAMEGATVEMETPPSTPVFSPKPRATAPSPSIERAAPPPPTERAGPPSMAATAAAQPSPFATQPAPFALPPQPPAAVAPAMHMPAQLADRAPRAAASASSSAASSTPPAPTRTQSSGCRYCGGALPAGRRALFCPHCGQNLTVQRCPACATELDLSWKFCLTCGRGVAAT